MEEKRKHSIKKLLGGILYEDYDMGNRTSVPSD